MTAKPYSERQQKSSEKELQGYLNRLNRMQISEGSCDISDYLGEKVLAGGYDRNFSPESVEVSKKLEPVYEKVAGSMANDSCGQQIMRVRRKQIRSIWMDRVIRFLQMRFIEN